MRVLHIGKLFAPSHGGIEAFMLDVCRHSHTLGVAQGVLVHADPAITPAAADNAPDLSFLSYLDRVPVLGSLGYAPISPQFGHRLSRALRQFKPTVLHLHLPNPSVFWVLMNRHARRLPWVIHWHADAWSPDYETTVRYLYPLYRPFEQALLKAAARVVVTSPPYLQASPALQAWRDKCVVVPLALDTQRLTASAEPWHTDLWQDGQRLRVLAVGRLTAYKGFEVLIKAASLTAAAAIDVVIAGDGREQAKLQGLVEALGVADRVQLVGNVTDSTRNQLLASCDLVCLPSLNRAEAFGVSVLEGMAFAKPAVVSKIEGSGLPWLVEHQVSGWHVPPNDAQALAQCLSELSVQREQVRAAGQRAAERHRDHFQSLTVVKQLIEVQQHAQSTRP